jgi:hypothetical protein
MVPALDLRFRKNIIEAHGGYLVIKLILDLSGGKRISPSVLFME